MSVDDVWLEKRALRQKAIAARQGLSAEQRAIFDGQIFQRLQLQGFYEKAAEAGYGKEDCNAVYKVI